MSVSVSVCVCVCLSVRGRIFGIPRPIFTQIFCACYIPMAVARSSSGGVVIRNVLPIYE